MASLTKAFKQMRHRGLIAKRECYCVHCGEEVLLGAVQQWRDKQREIRGFVHVGEWGPASTLEQIRVPLVFGSVIGDTVAHHDPSCLAVGEVVAECLKEQGIQYEWDRLPGNPILLKVDHSLSGLPRSHQHEIPVGEDHLAIHTIRYPDSAFDDLEGNSVRLLNLACLRELDIDAPHLQGASWEPRVQDQVKLGFFVPDALAPQARKECGDLIDRVQLEAMWVEVTKLLRKGPGRLCGGELVNVPLFIDPAKLRIGSPVLFRTEHVCSVVREPERRVKR